MDKLFETTIQTEEKYKQEFAQYLHDELGPFLSGIKLYIKELELSGKNDIHRKKTIKYLGRMVDEAIIKVKITSNSMMSNIFMDMGLKKALSSFVEKINKINYTKINLDINDLSENLNKTLEVLVYRIIIELINNSIKHGNPNNINIALYMENSFLRAEYKDNGKGFVIEDQLKSNSGIGLRSIIDRLKSRKATYMISSKLNEGMKFEFKLPVC